MSVEVIAFKKEGLKGTVVVEGDNFSSVTTSEAKNKSIDEATKHLGLCGISGQSGPYPVDDDGNEIVDLVKLSQMAKHGQTYKYRNEYNISQSLAL